MKPLFVFVRPPRPVWPFNGEWTAFWPPLAFASLAAAIREANCDIDVAILDAPTWRMGWATLETELAARRPTFVGIGEEAVSCADTFRAARIAKSLGARVIAGGCFFSHVAPQVLRTGLIDVVVHGEGERTLVEVAVALAHGDRDLRHVRGISFRDGDEVVFTGHRELIHDLDSLPLPAYDLLPVAMYGKHSRNHPGFAALELGRGCGHECSFCTLWRQMGEVRNETVKPRYRAKSPERVFDEVRWLIGNYGRRYIGWVDPCFNAHPHIPQQVASRLLSSGVTVGQSAWVRADCLMRDHHSGALRTLVDAGLNEVYLGLERPDSSGLALLNKRSTADAADALRILHEEYPDVFTVGSFIYGITGDTPERVRELFLQCNRLPLDQIFLIPLTPLPGTPYWSERHWDETGEAFRRFNFLPDTTGDGVGELSAALCRAILFAWSGARLRRTLPGLVSPNRRRRSMNRHLALRTLPLAVNSLLHEVTHRQHSPMYVPRWYED